MNVPVMKVYLHKKESEIIKYRNYSNFCNEEYSQHILKEMSSRAENNSITTIPFQISAKMLLTTGILLRETI